MVDDGAHGQGLEAGSPEVARAAVDQSRWRGRRRLARLEAARLALVHVASGEKKGAARGQAAPLWGLMEYSFRVKPLNFGVEGHIESPSGVALTSEG